MCVGLRAAQRFVFDFNLMQRSKIHETLEFGETVDMGRFGAKLSGSKEALAAAAAAAASTTTSGAAAATAASASTASTPDLELGSPKAGAKTQPREQQGGGEREPQQEKKPAVVEHPKQPYDLFAVLMHSGNAMGGHYYAYIKSFDDKVTG